MEFRRVLFRSVRQGQIDALARTLFASPALYPAEMRQCFALRTLVRAWSQYREDRAVMMGENLIGGECAAERDAFLTLLAAALPDPRSDLARAIQRVRQTAICERTKNTASDTPPIGRAHV